jgi:hypothetical protein
MPRLAARSERTAPERRLSGCGNDENAGLSCHLCYDWNFGFVEDDVVVVIVFLGIKIGVGVFLKVGNGLSCRERHLQTRLVRDMADQQKIFTFGFGDERGVLGAGHGIINLDSVVAGRGLLVDHADGFGSGVLIVENWPGTEDGGAEKFSFGDLVAPEQMRRTTVEIEDCGDTVCKVEGELDG